MKKKLYKSNKDHKLCGVCGGIAEYFNIDSTIVRIVTTVLAFIPGIGSIIIIGYIISAVAMPNNPDEIEFIPKDKNEIKKIYRSIDDRKIWGVCGGIAEYFNIDSTIVRILWIIFALALGSGIIAYIVATLVIPIKKV